MFLKYLLSGYFIEPSFGKFATQFIEYFPPYVLTASAYIIFAGLVYTALIMYQHNNNAGTMEH
ncbi:MAG: hypothetical protein AABY83_04215 [Pseudomonadota bacterium]